MEYTVSKENNFTLEFLLQALKGSNIITVFHLYGDEGSTLAFKGKVSQARKELKEYFEEIVTFIEPYLAFDGQWNLCPAFICEVKEILKK